VTSPTATSPTYAERSIAVMKAFSAHQFFYSENHFVTSPDASISRLSKRR